MDAERNLQTELAADALGPKVAPPYTPYWATQEDPVLANKWERYSPKARRVMRVHGDVRYYLWLGLESWPAIAEICEEPLRFRILVDDRPVTAMYHFWCRSTKGDDFFVDAFIGRLLRDAKPESDLAYQIRARVAFAQAQSLRYAISTDGILCRCPMLVANWSLGLGFLADIRNRNNSDLATRVRHCIRVKKRLTLAEIEAYFADEPKELVHASLFGELQTGAASADLATGPLSAMTVFISALT